ncbi:MAG: glycosyltransferase family 39 protein [Acidimicrobiia bacterium]
MTTTEVASETAETVSGSGRARQPVSRRTAALVVAVLAVGSFGLALILQQGLFPLSSLNHDEPIYVVGADLIRDGELTLPIDQADLFRPWASGVRDGHVVLKYPPVWPAVLAVSDLVTTSPRAGVALTAAAAAVLAYLLVVELGATRRAGIVAAGLLALSPIVVLQSGTMLPYLFLLALVLAAYYLVLRGVRRGRAAWLAAGGAVLGAAFFARPFDAVLAAIPLGVLVLAKERLGRQAWLRLGWIALGAAPLLVLTLAYNAYAMGDPLSFPFSVTGPDDRLGFGRRGVFASNTTHYTVRAAAQATWDNLSALPRWVFGGALTIGLAVLGLVRSRILDGRKWAVAGLALSFPVGYVAFWGPYAMSALWDGLEALGPFYHLPVVIPLAVFAGIAFDEIIARRAVLAAGAAAAMVALTLVAIVPAVDRNLDETDGYEYIDATIDDAGLDNSVLFVDYTPDTGFEARTPFLRNRADLDQPVLYAYDRGGANFAAVDRYPDRNLARLESVLEPDSSSGFNLGGFLLPDRHPFRSNVVVTPLEVERGPTFEETLIVHDPGAGATVIAYAAAPGGEPEEIRLGGKTTVAWTILSGPRLVAEPAGTKEGYLTLDEDAPAGEFVLGVRITPSDDGPVMAYELRYAYRLTGDGEVEVLTPGAQWALHGDIWYRQQIGDVLTAR